MDLVAHCHVPNACEPDGAPVEGKAQLPATDADSSGVQVPATNGFECTVANLPVPVGEVCVAVCVAGVGVCTLTLMATMASTMQGLSVPALSPQDPSPTVSVVGPASCPGSTTFAAPTHHREFDVVGANAGHAHSCMRTV